jgi:predicted nucleic acid-binding protein
VIVCPNTSPLIVLARIDRLDLLGDLRQVSLTLAVLGEIHDKRDEVARRVDGLLAQGVTVVEPAESDRIDPGRALGPGERSVLSHALVSGTPVVCVLDDQAARAEARRLGLRFTGTLGLVLRAQVRGGIARAGPVLREAVGAGLYLDEGTLARALGQIGEPWPPADPGGEGHAGR